MSDTEPQTTIHHRKLSLRERLAVWKFLEPILVQHGGGVVSYRAPWSDVEVAKAMSAATGQAFGDKHVASVRRELFGRIRPDRPPSSGETSPAVEVRLAALEGKLDRLAAALAWQDPGDGRK